MLSYGILLQLNSVQSWHTQTLKMLFSVGVWK